MTASMEAAMVCAVKLGRKIVTYDVGVGGDDHEGVEGEDGDGAPCEGGTSNLGRRHHCCWKRERFISPREIQANNSKLLSSR